MKAVSELVATTVGKDEAYVQVILQPTPHMTFGGNTLPTAHVDIASIGFPGGTPAELAPSFFPFFENHLGVSPERLYLSFTDLQRDHVAWNGKTFG